MYDVVLVGYHVVLMVVIIVICCCCAHDNCGDLFMPRKCMVMCYSILAEWMMDA